MREINIFVLKGSMKKAKIVKVRGKRFYLCEYTGAPIKNRYYSPAKKEKSGCFATLPIMLRYVHDHDGMNAYLDLKQKAEAFYQQPNIPMAPPLDITEVPLSKKELKVYMDQLPMGQAWFDVPKSMKLPKLAKRFESKTKN